MVHAADVPPHIIILGHRDLHGVGTAVTILLPNLWGGHSSGQEGLLTHIPPGSLPQEPSAASGALRAGHGVPKELGYMWAGHRGPPGLRLESPRCGHEVPEGLE